MAEGEREREESVTEKIGERERKERERGVWVPAWCIYVRVKVL